MRKEKGITLIALIITIIILLILVGVGTKVVVDGRLITSSKKSVNQINNRVEQEQTRSDYLLGELEDLKRSQCVHEWTDKEIIKQATCTEAGSKVRNCELCQKTMTVSIPALGHDYVNKACTRCGAAEPECSHTYGSWKITTKPTCIAEGSRTRTCTKCGTAQIEPIAATGIHNYVNGKCSVCGAAEPTPTVVAGEKATKNSKYTEGGKTAIIPAGFTVSGKDSEKTIVGGLVIYLIDDGKTVDWTKEAEVTTAKQKYDQFVWIPVSVNDMFMCQSKTESTQCNITLVNETPTCTVHNSTAMAGRLCAIGTGSGRFNSDLTTQTYNANSGIREPAVVTGKDDGTGTDYDGDSNNGISLETLRIEYNSAVKKIIQSGGFWVGRYETSGMSSDNSKDNTVTLNTVKGTSNGINNMSWYRMYKQQQNYANKKGLATSNNTKIQSTMIFGTAYDQVVKFAECSTVTTKIAVDSIVETGNVGAGCYKNIYNLCDNLCEWTTEAAFDGGRIYRGRSLWIQRFSQRSLRRFTDYN